MSRIKYIEKCRKPQRCGKCSKDISVGSPYYKGLLYRMPPIVRCISCGLKGYEVTTSEYVRTVGRLVEDWSEDFPVGETTVEEIISVLDEALEECQDKLENMPEQLQEESESGQLLQERIAELESAMNELESADEWNTILSDAFDGLDEEVQQIIEEEKRRRNDAEYEEWYPEFQQRTDESGIEAAECWRERVEEILSSIINDALCQLSY